MNIFQKFLCNHDFKPLGAPHKQTIGAFEGLEKGRWVNYAGTIKEVVDIRCVKCGLSDTVKFIKNSCGLHDSPFYEES